MKSASTLSIVRLLSVLGAILLFCPAHSWSADLLAGDAAYFRRELSEHIMPYWLETAVDTTNGGFLLADDLKGRSSPLEKQIVTQSRMIWGFSHVHRKHLGTDGRDYLGAARQGYRFLTAHFLDRENGGYFWSTDLQGNVRNDEKVLYGECFVIYALVEYHRASGEAQPLKEALDLFDLIQKRAHDTNHQGWVEHFTRKWTPTLEARAGVEIPGLRSANAHLHWMEALTELYEETREARVKSALIEALTLNQRYFYPPDPAKAALHRKPDWTAATGPQSLGVSYGHNVEFAWLMIRVERVLGQPLSWPHFFAYIDHALAHGYDHERGGLYSKGFENQPASDTEKIWWVQAEMLAALTDAIAQDGKQEYKTALHSLIEFVRRYQTDPKDGIWIESVTAEGRPRSTAKAQSWKANYHDVRGIVKFIEASPVEK